MSTGYETRGYPYPRVQLPSLIVDITYIGDIWRGLERSRIRRPMSDDLVVPVHFEVGQELCFRLLDHPLLVLLKLELLVSRQGFPSRLYDVA
jgi:hypothetical protein